MKKISVVIPVLNEDGVIGSLLSQLTRNDSFLEIIVVDGGSTDATGDKVREFHGVKWLQAEAGRAKQMNYGAAMATGDILWFLHADSNVPENSAALVTQAMAHSPVGGSFFLKLDQEHLWLDVFSKLSRLNMSIFTYGDQGIFVRRDTFKELNGFKEIPIMEDLDLVRRIKKKGSFTKLPHAVSTSARRFMKNGVVRQELKNVLLVLGYYAGISPYYLARYYRS